MSRQIKLQSQEQVIIDWMFPFHWQIFLLMTTYSTQFWVDEVRFSPQDLAGGIIVTLPADKEFRILHGDEVIWWRIAVYIVSYCITVCDDIHWYV